MFVVIIYSTVVAVIKETNDIKPHQLTVVPVGTNKFY